MAYRRESEILEDEIAATRRRIEARLERLNDDASPVGLINSAIGAESNSVPDTLSALIDRAKANPLSAALIGAGVAGLLMTEQKLTRSSKVGPDVDDPKEDRSPAERVAGETAALKARARTAAADARNVVSDARATAADVAGSGRDAVSAVGDTVSSGLQNAADTIGDAGDALGDAARVAPRELRARGGQLIDWVKENPLPAGLMALAAGAGIASLLTGRNASAPASRLQSSQRLHEMARTRQDEPDRVDRVAADLEGSAPVAPASESAMVSDRKTKKRVVRSTSALGVDPD